MRKSVPTLEELADTETFTYAQAEAARFLLDLSKGELVAQMGTTSASPSAWSNSGVLSKQHSTVLRYIILLHLNDIELPSFKAKEPA